ncbi:MAG TPA: cysteine--tRNA ligase [Steroidobacteraceae bacterium]
MLQIHNSLSGRKEPFTPLVEGEARMYVCGITVYDYLHVGHARSQIAFDVVRRWLRASGYRVTYVRNITDIDDKIIQRARERGESVEGLTARYIDAMDEDFAALGIEKPDHEPRATAYIREIVQMIERLRERGFAYVGESGDVLYSVAKFEGYGRLSGKKLADLRAGARVEVDEQKRDPLDFVLWKRAKPGEPAWESPWGPGRPGWHIECSAMAVALLGPHFDIHGGGMDLKFPHHENEIAQSCAACDAPFARVWMHNGFVRVNEEKMSKSLGNFFTVREVLPRLRPEVLRFFLLSSHYRGPVNYGEDNLRQADAALTRLYLALRGVTPARKVEAGGATKRFAEAMDDDFNTPEALAALQSLARELNVAKTAGDGQRAGRLAAELVRLGAHLGLLERKPEEWLSTRSEITGGTAEAAPVGDAEVETLVAARIAARKARDFKESDRIRDELAAHGIVLEDGAAGTTWRRK